MVNYGYNKETPNWNESRKWILAEELSKALNIPIVTKNNSYKNDGKSPYIEVGEIETQVIAGWCGVDSCSTLYDGVRIRRITYLSEKQHQKLVETADKIYDKVMCVALIK